MPRFERALITGATSGIGAAFAAALPSDTHLLLTGRRLDRLAAEAERRATSDREAITVPADLATDAGRAEVIARAEARGIDLLVCNAGVGVYGGFDVTPVAAEREALEVNVLAPTLLVHALLPGMLARARRRARRAGLIIISSSVSFDPLSEAVTYSAAKAYLLQFGRGLTSQLRDEPIDVLTVLPTYTRTEFFTRAGIAQPAEAMSADQVARDALRALGRETVHFSGWRRQQIAWLLNRNPVLKVWRWPSALAASRRRAAGRD